MHQNSEVIAKSSESLAGLFSMIQIVNNTASDIHEKWSGMVGGFAKDPLWLFRFLWSTILCKFHLTSTLSVVLADAEPPALPPAVNRDPLHILIFLLGSAIVCFLMWQCWVVIQPMLKVSFLCARVVIWFCVSFLTCTKSWRCSLCELTLFTDCKDVLHPDRYLACSRACIALQTRRCSGSRQPRP